MKIQFSRNKNHKLTRNEASEIPTGPRIVAWVGGGHSEFRIPNSELGGWAAFLIPHSYFLISLGTYFLIGWGFGWI